MLAITAQATVDMMVIQATVLTRETTPATKSSTHMFPPPCACHHLQDTRTRHLATIVVAALVSSFVPTSAQHAQVVLGQGMVASFVLAVKDRPSMLVNALTYPVYAAAASAFVLLLELALRPSPVETIHARFHTSEATLTDNTVDAGNKVPSTDITGRIKQLGEYTVFGFQLVRLFSVLALLTLAIVTFAKDETDEGTSAEFVHLAHAGVVGAYAYAFLLSLIAVLATADVSRLIRRHLGSVLLISWTGYLYRDIWPLATYTLTPADKAEGPLLWAKFSLLTVAAVLVPLFVPRQYVPVDLKNPFPEPAPEQTASIFSLIIYAWLDPTVLKAYRVPHLELNELPPLADSDHAANLIEHSYPHLDPFKVKKRRHLFFGLMRVFRKEYSVMATMVALRSAMKLASPFGINRLLAYLESEGKNAVVRPWVWILWLLLGPVFSSILIQWYIYLGTRTLAHAQSVVTSLVFDHALRIRVKAETDEGSGSNSSTAVNTPDNASVVGTSEAGDEVSEGSDTARATETSDAASKGKKKADSEIPGKDEKAADKKGGNLVGKINNLVTTDLQNITTGRDFLLLLVDIPVQVTLCVFFLYSILGWSAFCGMGVMIVCFPAPGYVASLIQGVQKAKMKRTDARVQSVTETMGVIRMIKLFGWEPRVQEQVMQKREDELIYQRKSKILELMNGILNHVIPLLTMMFTYSTFTLIMKRDLNASIVFSSMAVFDMLSGSLHDIFGLIPEIIRAKVSLDRVNEFLGKTELLDEYSEKENDKGLASDLVIPKPEVGDVIGFRNASFTWTADNDGTLTPGPQKRNFTLRIEDELIFQKGKFNLIVGPTGSGKTSTLMALLGEMHYIPSGPESFFNLPRSGGVAYASQESWVQNETIRDNILFGQPFDEVRYNKVIDQCGLKRDLTLFEAGDKTEVGEKGLTLSGGQKARITLARAVYSHAEILLLDDILAALDVHTSRWIVDKCFKGDLIRGRTVILVTHNVSMASPVAHFVVSLGKDGRIASQGSLDKVLDNDLSLAAEAAEEITQIEKAEDEVDQPADPAEAAKSDGKLILAEEVALGHVGWPALKMFFSGLSGRHPVLFWGAFVGLLLSYDLLTTAQAGWLGIWARQYVNHMSSDVNVVFYLSVYASVLLVSCVSFAVAWIVYVFATMRASRSIHQTLVASILGTTLRWLDVTPTSRIIARCTQDIAALDGGISDYFFYLVEMTLSMSVKLAAIVFMSPIFVIPGIAVALLGGLCGQIYMKAQLSVKREMSNARAPVLGHFGAAIAGLVSIRAYGAQDAFQKEAIERINRYTRAARINYNLNRWVGIRIEFLGACFAASLATYLVYGHRADASTTGFSLNMAIAFCNMILWWVRIFNNFEVSGNSLERIQQYVVVEQETNPTEDGVPPAYWPASGDLRVEKLSARYSPDGPRVLHEISFEVKSGERVGIVGRTGSGKSSLTLSLLRCILTEGKVYYDGVATDSINLEALRNHITIIPQVPELLSGTLRQNLDPFQMHDDAVLYDALRSAGLFSVQNEEDEGRITLDTEISSGGSNLSVGQRQILALARAIVRQSKLLILDEATSAIDYHTDSVIQQSLRKELSKDVTLLTIAHRLQTIMDADKIIVLDAGRITEFGKPAELLENENGMLRALVDESGDRDALYAMAEGTSSSSPAA